MNKTYMQYVVLLNKISIPSILGIRIVVKLFYKSNETAMYKLNLSHWIFLKSFLFLIIFSTVFFSHQEIIRLTWDANVEPDLSHYIMHRDTIPGTMVFLDNIPRNSTTYADTQVVNWKIYYYKLTAVDSLGYESLPSNEVFAIADSVITVIDESQSFIYGYELKQNYPNPFNPSTTIEYILPKSSKVTLIVYNILGNEIRRLVDGFKRAGNYKIIWDGKDNNRLMISSGLYFYRIIAGDYRKIRKSIFKK